MHVFKTWQFWPYVNIFMYTRTHAHVRIFSPYVNIFMYAHMHACIHTYAHACIHTAAPFLLQGMSSGLLMSITILIICLRPSTLIPHSPQLVEQRGIEPEDRSSMIHNDALADQEGNAA